MAKTSDQGAGVGRKLDQSTLEMHCSTPIDPPVLIVEQRSANSSPIC